MCTTGERQTLITIARRVWALGGIRAFYRGLGVRPPLARPHTLELKP